jgi:hypothetical protein
VVQTCVHGGLTFYIPSFTEEHSYQDLTWLLIHSCILATLNYRGKCANKHYLTAVVDETRKVAALGCIYHVVQINSEEVGGSDTLQKCTVTVKLPTYNRVKVINR